jgi:hypothetical protein
VATIEFDRMSRWARPLAYLTIAPVVPLMLILAAVLIVCCVPLLFVVAIDGGRGWVSK